MKLKIYPTIAIAMMMLGTATSSADTAIQIHLQEVSTEPLQMSLSDIRKITFNQNEINFVLDDATEVALELSEVSKLTFSGDVSVESLIKDTEKVAIVPNPVVSNFKILGADKYKGETLTIYSINGQIVNQTAAWDGEAIDVSNLPQGIYLLNINTLTIKFIKS